MHTNLHAAIPRPLCAEALHGHPYQMTQQRFVADEKYGEQHVAACGDGHLRPQQTD